MELVRVATQIGKPFSGKQPLYLAPLGDIQWNGDMDEIWTTGLQAYIEEAMRLGAWFVGLGDYVDFASPSTRAKLKPPDLYDSGVRRLDSTALDMLHDLYNRFLKVTKGRWLGLLHGHHYWQFTEGDTTDTRLCQMLDAPYLGTSAVLQLVFDGPSRGGEYLVWCHHGIGGASESAMILRLKRMAQYWERINLFLMGHATKKPVTPIPRVEPQFAPGHPKLVHRDVYLVGTGGWLKNLVESRKMGQFARGGYPEEKMLDPVSLGAPIIQITPQIEDSHRNGRRIVQWKPRTRVIV